MSFDIAALNIVDFATIIVLVISGVLATLRGMTREIMGLAGWPISIVAARLTAPYLEPLLTDTIRVEGISSALAWGIPFIVVVVLWFAFASVVSPGLSKAGLGGLDRWLGFLFGLIRGFVIVLVIYVGAVIAAVVVLNESLHSLKPLTFSAITRKVSACSQRGSLLGTPALM